MNKQNITLDLATMRERLCDFISMLYGMGLLNDDQEQEIRLDYLQTSLITDDDIKRIFGGEE